MRINRAFLSAIAIITLMPEGAAGQFYDTGQSPASIRWEQIRTDSLRIIYPEGFEDGARRTLFYMDTVRTDISYGFSLGPARTPVVLHTENFLSNGLAMLGPKRIEMTGVPSSDTYANPWLKQLAVHEYRHMVQYNNIRRSTVRVLSYLFGEQVWLLSTGLLPFWFLEGDAVMAETQFSTFGRGLQPSFSMHYRAVGHEMLAKRNPDKWFCGSYRHYVPSHYELGYQLTSRSRQLYGDYLWDHIARYSADFPFLLFTTQLGLNKYADTSTKKLFHNTFSYLNDHWDSLPERDDSADVIAPPNTSYTVYEHPLFIGDSTIIALKTDFDRAQRFVIIDVATGAESHVCHTGMVSSRPVYLNGKVWWTEYRQSAFWGQKVNSVLRCMNIGEWKPRDVPGEQAALYPTPVSDEDLAYVRYNYDGFYSIVEGRREVDFPKGVSLHGLAYDDVTDKLYYIALSDEGMWIEGMNMADGAAHIVTPPSYTTIGNLSAADGKLYFGSIQSGYDEAHMYDLAGNQEYRITTSRYGSFAPSASPDGSIVALTVYDKEGYHVAVQEAVPAEKVFYSHVPENVLNPDITSWDIINTDGVVYGEKEAEDSKSKHKRKRYSKALNMFNLHSWAPVDFDPFNVMSASEFNINAGITLISADVLNTTQTMVNYGLLGNGYSVAQASFKYLGFAPKFEVNAVWSNVNQTTVLQTGVPEPSGLKDYFGISGRVYMPVILSSGYRIRTLTPNLQYLYTNTIYGVAEQTGSGPIPRYTYNYIKGSHILAGVVAYADYVRSARLDIIPRWGYALRATALADPVHGIISPTASLYGRIYMPGIVRHHGISVSGSYQKQLRTDLLTYGVIDLLPRGMTMIYPTEYVAVSANYYFPVAYPDWGASGLFFLKRIYASVGLDVARDSSIGRLTSYGGTAYFDLSFFRLPAQGACTLSVSAYKSVSGMLWSFGITMPL